MLEVMKPSTEVLDQMQAAAMSGGKSPETWLSEYLVGVAGILDRDPMRYRAYGPFWWGLKKALYVAGFTRFGAFIDVECAEVTNCGSMVKNVLAAHAYEEYAVGYGLIFSSAHDFASPEGEAATYTLADDDMETLAGEKRIVDAL